MTYKQFIQQIDRLPMEPQSCYEIAAILANLGLLNRWYILTRCFFSFNRENFVVVKIWYQIKKLFWKLRIRNFFRLF
jgi:hypothetical protein